MNDILLIGCGFVADLYMKSFATFPNIQIAGVYDIDQTRLGVFCNHWKLRSFTSLTEALAAQPRPKIVLNLTNPGSHFEVSKQCLEAGFHVYSEKPLAMQMDHAHTLHSLAAKGGLLLASAPCSVLSETAQTLGSALRQGIGGVPRLIYAELDDDFVPQAPYRKWLSETGAPWPFEDEFRVGCTVEHAGYYLAWMIGLFGSVRTVSAASADILPDKLPGGTTTPDFSVATLFFENGMIARLTCSIIAPHNHRLRLVCDEGVLEVDEAWNNSAAVRFRRRFVIRRRLINHPIARRIRLKGPTHPKVGRWGAASMNFALGPVEMLDAITEKRPCRLSADLALHLNEVTLAIQNAGEYGSAQKMTTRCAPLEPMGWAL